MWVQVLAWFERKRMRSRVTRCRLNSFLSRLRALRASSACTAADSRNVACKAIQEVDCVPLSRFKMRLQSVLAAKPLLRSSLTVGKRSRQRMLVCQSTLPDHLFCAVHHGPSVTASRCCMNNFLKSCSLGASPVLTSLRLTEHSRLKLPVYLRSHLSHGCQGREEVTGPAFPLRDKTFRFR